MGKKGGRSAWEIRALPILQRKDVKFMRMKKSRRWLSALLAVLMLLTMIPTVAFAAGSTSDDFYKIVHLDCGRKYFSADWIKTLIDDMAEDGYTHLELAFGNDGLRFLLDDMSVTVDETTYTDEQVTAGVQAGNKAYYDFDTNELTEDEMDSIIAHANTKGIEIIPLLNTPGHMDAIITAMARVGIDGDYNGSVRTVDVTNEAAVAFTQALVGKYINYFAGKGCSVFNIGADEYANDVYTTGGMGFAQLVNAGQYDEFVTYVNGLATLVNKAGMTPMTFNDGIYYNSTTRYGTFDSNIMIAYWSSGWTGYNVASASYLANKGHKMINTNGDFYYVLGKTDSWDNNGSSYASNWDNAKFMDTTFTEEQAGGMFCIWCDYPNAETEDQIYTKVVTNGVLSAMSKAMGHMPESGGSTDPKDVTVEDKATGVSVTAPGLTDVTVEAKDSATDINGAAQGKVVSYDITPVTNDGKYTGEASVSMPVPSTWNTSRICGYVRNSDDTVTNKISGTVANGMFTFTMPHFSEGGAYEADPETVEVTENETITVTVDGTETATISGANYAGTYTTENPSIATVEVTGTDATEATTEYTQASVTCNTLISSDKSNWTAVSGYYYKADDGNYYPVYAQRSSSGWFSKTYTYTWGYSTTSSTSNVTQIGTQSTTNISTAPNITVYTKSGTDGTPASTTVTFTGHKVGMTYVTVGNTRYTIIVEPKSVTPLTIEYWITNGHPTDNNGKNSYSVSAADACSEAGVDISTLLPANTTKDGRTLEYWCGRLLDKDLSNSSTSEKQEQTETSGDDETLSGFVFTKVRYWNGEWQVYTTD